MGISKVRPEPDIVTVDYFDTDAYLKDLKKVAAEYKKLMAEKDVNKNAG